LGNLHLEDIAIHFDETFFEKKRIRKNIDLNKAEVLMI